MGVAPSGTRTIRRLETALRGALPRFRWFGAKSRAIRRVTVVDRAPLPEAGRSVELLLCRVSYANGRPDLYLIPADLASVSSAVPEKSLRKAAAVAPGRDLADDPVFASALIRRILAGGTWPTKRGGLIAASGQGLPRRLPAPQRLGGEQSNTSIRFGRLCILKLMRRLETGVSPEAEIGRHLRGLEASAHVPPLLATLDYVRPGQPPLTLGCVHAFVPNRGDAWSVFLERMPRWSRGRHVSRLPTPDGDWVGAAGQPVPARIRRLLTPFADMAGRLGRRTAELHLALARTRGDRAFAPEPIAASAQAALCRAVGRQLRDTLALVPAIRAEFPPATRIVADRLMANRANLQAPLLALRHAPASARAIRTHGDYHLGQVLFTGRDFVAVDFEGEPARPLAERRRKQSPLRDVAGMLRSFHYAACVGLAGAPGALADRWLAWVCIAFLHGYRAALGRARLVPRREADFRRLLDVFLLEKALYELHYELNNRPAWVHVPLAGLLKLTEDRT